jgi:hypothetical protein
MRSVVAKHKENRSSAVGSGSAVDVEVFEIEPSDVAKERPNYLGFRHRTWIFTSSDVGAKIEVLSGGLHRCPESHKGCPWTCWSFLERL